MNLKSYFLAILLAAAATVTTASAQTPDGEKSAKFDFTDLVPEGKVYDGFIYVVGEKHYVVESTDAFFAALKIDPKKDVKSMAMIMATNPNSKDKVEPVQKLVPEKYRDFKGIGVFYLHEK